MLAIAGALMCRPELLLVDELSLGLAPGRRRGSHAAACSRSATSSASPSCWSSRAPPRRWTIADYGYVLENGRIVLDGDRERLKSHQDIQEFYLGQAGGERRSYRAVKQYRRSRRWYG